MAEALPPEPERDPVGPPEFDVHPFGEPLIEQYEPHPDGSVQFADSFDEPGLTIDFEAHPYTSTYGDEEHYPGESMADTRQALIYDVDGGVHYLQGNRLYDVNRSAEQQSPTFIEFTGNEPKTYEWNEPVPKRVRDATPWQMPKVTIGKNLPMLYGGKKVAGVLIATELAGEGDPFVDDMHDIATDGGEDPFKDVRDFLDALAAEPAPPRDPRDPGVYRSSDGLYAFASARTHDYDPQTREGMGGKKISVETRIHREQGAPYPRVAVNKRTGRRISPTAQTQEDDPGEHERVFDLVSDRRREIGGAVLRRLATVTGIQHLVEQHRANVHQEWLEDKARAKRGDRPAPKRRLL